MADIISSTGEVVGRNGKLYVGVDAGVDRPISASMLISNMGKTSLEFFSWGRVDPIEHHDLAVEFKDIAVDWAKLECSVRLTDAAMRRLSKVFAGLKPSDATVTTSFEHGLHTGDRLVFSGDTNRTRRHTTTIDSATSFGMAAFVRPSRGYARHVRRVKAMRRKHG